MLPSARTLFGYSEYWMFEPHIQAKYITLQCIVFLLVNNNPLQLLVSVYVMQPHFVKHDKDPLKMLADTLYIDAT